MGTSVNIKAENDTIAAAIAQQVEVEFSDADPKLLSLVRLLVAENSAIRQSIDTLRLELQAAHALADRDPLCPVFNRRAFMRELEREIARTERHERALSLLFIDLDKFKAVNDQHGHEAGDQTLIAMARTLLRTVRKTDIVSRIGGDEFAILLIETDLNNAHKCSSALASRIAAANIGISASIGVAGWTPGMTADQLMANADRAMFIEKARPSLV
jgi:diguanylate cyclase (GGDEF)-like protein